MEKYRYETMKNKSSRNWNKIKKIRIKWVKKEEDFENKDEEQSINTDKEDISKKQDNIKIK